MIGWFEKLVARFRRPQPQPEARFERVVHELIVGEDGTLTPVYPEAPEKMLTKAEAVKLLDELSFDWRMYGAPPCHVVGGQEMYSESDLIEWLIPSGVVHRDPRTGEIATDL